MQYNLTELAREFTEWSIPTFENANAGTSLKKLEAEVVEVWQAMASDCDYGVAEEYADCIMCLFDSAARLGISPEMIAKEFADKLAINKSRQWAQNEDGTYSHVKPEDLAPDEATRELECAWCKKPFTTGWYYNDPALSGACPDCLPF